MFGMSGAAKVKELEPLKNEKSLKDLTDKEKEKLIGKIIDELVIQESSLINEIRRNLKPKADIKDKIKKYLNNKHYELSEVEFNNIYSTFKHRVWGYGILDPLIDSDTISDIRLVSYKNIRIKELGERKSTELEFASEEEFNNYIIDFVANKNNITISENNSMQVFTDTTTSDKFILRIDMVGVSLTKKENNPYMHIRKLPKDKDLLPDLIQKKFLTEELAEHFKTRMKAGLGILVCGKGGEGKTTFINALIEEIPHNKSGLIVQETEELFSKNHPELIPISVLKASGDSKTEYSLADIIQKHGLVGDFDYMIVGEIKGSEAYDLSNAAFTGHIPLGSVHTDDSKSAPDRIVTLMRLSKAGNGMTYGSLLATLVGFDEIVFIKDFKINEITQIAGYDRKNEQLILNPVYKYRIKEDRYEKLNDDCEKVKEKIEYAKFKNR